MLKIIEVLKRMLGLSNKCFPKRCIIYKTEKEYKIVTESESDTGLGLGDEPIFILPVGG